MTHHIFCLYFATKVIILGCSSQDAVWPPVESDWTYFKWIETPECRLRPYEIQILGAIWTASYLVWDTARLLFFEPELSQTDKQMIPHHFVCISLCLSPLGGFFIPGVGMTFQSMEMPTIFIVLRRYIPSEYKTLTLVNNLAFFAAFTIFRVVLFTWTC